MKQYVRKNNDNPVSALGFGFMRAGKDEMLNERMIRYAVENGVNYIDTAYIYPGNEAALGAILERTGLRDAVNIATKLPPYLVNKISDAERILKTSLERLRTNRAEYYLLHALNCAEDFYRLKELGIVEWIKDKKESGQIKNIGFSFHGGTDEFLKLIDAYDWDFCMIQYNYMDEFTQGGRRGVEHAYSKGIPVMVMEPLRGGTLANRLPSEAVEVFSNYEIKRSPAEWSLRWLWNQPGVQVVLSGMKTMENMEENIRVANESQTNMLTESELEVYSKVKDIIRLAVKVPCTGCGYCVPCPRGVDIPVCFDAYNHRSKGIGGLYFYITRTFNHNAGLCSECGKCEAHCPQRIAIRSELRGVRKRMEGFLYKPARFVIKKVFKRR